MLCCGSVCGAPDKDETLGVKSTVSRTSLGRGPLTCLRILAAITACVAAALVTLAVLYMQGHFPFETFIGPIGPSMFISASVILALASSTILAISYSS